LWRKSTIIANSDAFTGLGKLPSGGGLFPHSNKTKTAKSIKNSLADSFASSFLWRQSTIAKNALSTLPSRGKKCIIYIT
jgi:hypothetical protein